MERLSRREALIVAGLGALGFNALQDRTKNDVSNILCDEDYERAVQQVRNSVFKISGPNGHGTGVLIAPGYVITNAHVVKDNAHVLETNTQFLPLPIPVPIPPLNIQAVNDPNYKLHFFRDDDRNEDRHFRANIAHLSNGSRAIHKDLALLQLPVDSPVEGPPVTIGRPRRGQRSMALGNPHDLTGHVTTGRISKEVIMMNDDPDWRGVPFVGFDGGVNPGNSGGGAFGIRRENGELRTELIGMPTYTYRGAQGLGGCIRSDYIAYICTVKWGLKLFTEEQVLEFERQFPMCNVRR